MKIQIATLIATLLLLTGCSTTGKIISPATVKLGVSTSVSYAVDKYPTAAPYIRAAAPVICAAANGTDLNPTNVIAAIQSSEATALKTPEGVLILNTALLLYIGVWESYGVDAVANTPALKLYLQATCDGITWVLPPVSETIQSRGAYNWPLVPFESKSQPPIPGAQQRRLMR